MLLNFIFIFIFVGKDFIQRERERASPARRTTEATGGGGNQQPTNKEKTAFSPKSHETLPQGIPRLQFNVL